MMKMYLAEKKIRMTEGHETHILFYIFTQEINTFHLSFLSFFF